MVIKLTNSRFDYLIDLGKNSIAIHNKECYSSDLIKYKGPVLIRLGSPIYLPIKQALTFLFAIDKITILNDDEITTMD